MLLIEVYQNAEMLKNFKKFQLKWKILKEFTRSKQWVEFTLKKRFRSWKQICEALSFASSYQKPFIRFWSTCAALTTFTVRLSLYLVLEHTIQSFKHSIELFETETWLSFCLKSYSRDDFLALRQSQQHLESSTAYLDYNKARAVETDQCKKSCF